MNGTSLKNIKSIHFVGIKGVGMTPLAIIAKEAGIKVTGSDINEEFITDWALKKVGINPITGFNKTHLDPPAGGLDLVITTGAHGGFDNPEVKEAKRRGIKVFAQGEAVGFFMKNFGEVGISVAGSHGKTTVTAMLATILSKNNLDPSYLVGTANINRSWLPGHYGMGKYFVAEADEYANEPQYDRTSKFIYQRPKIIIVTNIDFDHPDMFVDTCEIRDAFAKFVITLPKDGLLVCCGDDTQINKLLKEINVRVVTYGRLGKNDFVLSHISINDSKTYFWVDRGKLSLGEFVLSVPGSHNALNALATIATSLELGIDIDNIKRSLPSFTGTKRRFEFIGEKNGTLLYDDYAHHPTEIKATLSLARGIFPKKKIIAIFQPHTYSRTKALFNEFAHAFGDAGEVVLTDIYPSLREERDPTVTSAKLVNKISKFHPMVRFLPSFPDVLEYLHKLMRKEEDLVVITMGAGDIYKVAYSLIASSV